TQTKEQVVSVTAEIKKVGYGAAAGEDEINAQSQAFTIIGAGHDHHDQADNHNRRPHHHSSWGTNHDQNGSGYDDHSGLELGRGDATILLGGAGRLTGLVLH
ncbi:MAG: hypothetical protein ACKOFX_09090, partial [Solirubrobacterales bacterium]